MLPAAKKILAYALLLVVAIPLFFSAYFVVKQQLIQQQVKEKMEAVTVQTISIPLTEAQWVKEGKEILIEGKLFDIKSYSISGDNIILNGLFDNEEDELIAKTNNSFQHNKTNNQPLTQLIAKYLSLPLYAGIIFSDNPKDWVFIGVYFPPYIEPTAAAHCLLAVPPPEFS
jgi:hypothetical protein